MKNVLYILATILLFTSCKSIERMIESGNYDQALRYGVDKLKGKKNKKTKYVKGLEKAYRNLNLQDLENINKLKLIQGKNNLDRVVALYINMEKRQNYITPLVPLISEDGYEARIHTREYANLISLAMSEASNMHYELGIQNLTDAINTANKRKARKAYNHFIDAQQYIHNYKDTYEKKQEAYNLGQSIILIEPYIAGTNITFKHTEEVISYLDINRLNSKWEKFITNQSIEYDFVATLEVLNILPGKEVEHIKSYTETKEVIDGKIPVKDLNGLIVKDSIGNTIYTNKKELVTAYVEEIIREKIAHMNGKIVILDARTNSHIKSIPIDVTYNFEDYSCIVRGDERALDSNSKNRIKPYCNPFPTDFQMTSDLAHAYKDAAEEILSRQKFI